MVCKYGSLNEGTFALAVAKFVYDKHTLLYDTHLQMEADVEINRGFSLLQTLWRSLLCSCGICDM
jgi:hypothetical protein